ncbi:MAG: class I SAM-dependent methyltransferase [Candidatus Thorarchaeota archaeon]|nr:MAG: class I SAM-dependent methyltransferase [Candidatus Thorarchaeota archaeon]
MATILMRLSEERATKQYDRWISLLTLGQDRRLRSYIVNEVLPRRGSVLDLGCGTGTLLIEAGRRGLRGVGVDMNERMLEVARERSRNHNLGRRIDFQHGDVTELKLHDDSFDLVVSTLVASELQSDKLARFFSEARRVAVTGGRIAIGAEGLPAGRTIGGLFSLIRGLSYRIAAKFSQLKPHPLHEISRAMKAAGITPKYRVRFLGGLLELYVAEVA